MVVELVGTTSLEAASCKNLAGYDPSLGCVPATGPTLTPLRHLHLLSRCQCNWDVDVNFNASFLDNNLPFVDVDTTANGVTIVNTAADTPVKTSTLPALPAAGNAYRLDAGGVMDTSGNYTIKVGVTYGGTSVCTYTMTPLNNSSFNWAAKASLVALTAAKMQMTLWVWFTTSAATTVVDFKHCLVTGAPPVATVGISTQMSHADSGTDFVMNRYTMEVVK